MKKFIILLVLSTIANYGYSQSFTASWEVDNQTKLVHIFVDTDFSSNSILIKKEFVQASEGTSVENHNLVLIGEFQATGSNFVLDYENYIYYYITFDPEGPIHKLNNSLPAGITQGTLFLDNTAAIGGGGNRTYWCDCGGNGAIASDPGGCVSQLSLIWMGPKIVRCINDGSSCKDGCIGTSTPGLTGSPSTGGVMIQVAKEKDLLIHNIGTRR